VGLGLPLALTCVALFVLRGRGTPAPFDPPREFVATGPYRLVRNPMYVGGMAVLLGWGLILLSPSIVLLAVGFMLLAHVFVVFYEEPALEKSFDASYLEYKRSVGRWLPKWRRLPPFKTFRGSGRSTD
jgi:protein-S-isoprenylcysteine O-methyltransferase Ste14